MERKVKEGGVGAGREEGEREEESGSIAIYGR